MKRWLFPFFIAIALSWLAVSRTEGFSERAVSIPLVSGQNEPVPFEIEKALAQPYRYLASGRQAYVFASEDGKTVLKLFKKSYLFRPWYVFSQKERVKRARRFRFYQESYSIAAKELAESAALLYVHLSPAKELLPTLLLTDKANRHFRIDLNRTPFVLQRRGESLFPAFEALYQSRGEEGLAEALKSFLQGIAERIAKGIGDGDSDVKKNFGMLEGKILHFDMGRLYYDERLKTGEASRIAEEWERSTRQLFAWLRERYPEFSLKNKDFFQYPFPL